MSKRHRILIVDDDPVDREAVVRALHREAARIDGIEADVLEVDTVTRAREALQAEEFACVFLDHHLPDGTSLDLLTDLRAQGLATPVVVLTGQRDENTIVGVMKAGAVDYLPKDRLHPDLVARSLRAALRFLQSQREKQAVLDELHLRDRAIAAASNGIAIADPRQPDCPLVYVNQAFLDMTGYAQEEVLGRNCRFLQGPETDPAAVLELGEAIRGERACQVLIRNYRKDGTDFWNEVTVSPVWDAHGVLTHFIGVQTDTTARYEADGERARLLVLARRQAEELSTLYKREQRIAEALQRSLLNTPLTGSAGLEVETIYRPAWDEAQVGGDFYDCFPLDEDRLALVVGDVSGKGLQAASRTAEIKYTLRAYLREFRAAARTLTRLNAFLCEAQALDDGDDEYFVVLTLIVVSAATGAAEVAVAGGDPPLLLRADGPAEEIQAGGTPLGVAARAAYASTEVHLSSGDLLLVTTDGITEARRGHAFLGNEGLVSLAQEARASASLTSNSLTSNSLAGMGRSILDGAEAFARGHLHDDVCLLLARRR